MALLNARRCPVCPRHESNARSHSVQWVARPDQVSDLLTGGIERLFDCAERLKVRLHIAFG